MKQLLSLVLAFGLIFSLAACGVLVSYDTPKSEELSAAYDFYSDSQRSLASGMAITPEQADDVFMVLVSCGMNGKVSDVTRKWGDDGHCTVTADFSKYDVYYTDGVVDRVEKSGKELYPNPEIDEPLEQPEEVEPEPEKVYEYDALQNIFMAVTADTTIEELWALISENNLPFTVQEYNGGKVTFCIAYTDGAALQRYADAGDHLEVTFDILGDNYMSNENQLMTVQYVNGSWISALLYVYGTWYDFQEDDKGNDYSGYYIVDHFSKEDGITIKYENGNETTTDYFEYDTAEEVIQKMIDGER